MNKSRGANSQSTAGPDICLTGGTALNVYSGELLKSNVAIKGERFDYVDTLPPCRGEETAVIDVHGKILVPGYIEPHCHPWFLYNPVTLAQEACTLGTTTFVCDNLVFFSLMGVGLFEAFMDCLAGFPVKFFWFCRSNPQTPMKDEKELFSVKNVERLLRHPAAVSLGEITRWQDLLSEDPDILELIHIAKNLGKRVDGHTAGAKNDKIQALARLGIESCHESINAREVMERLRAGLWVMLRESSLRQDLKGLLKAVTESGALTDRMMLTTDSSSPAFHREKGITDHLLKTAFKEGIDPVAAYRMVTINPALYFGMERDIGGIAPGRYADILVLDDLLDPVPEMVFSKGRMVAKEGKPSGDWPVLDWKKFLPETSFIKRKWRAKRDYFEIRSKQKEVSFPVIRLVSAVITRVEQVLFPAKDGLLDLEDRAEFSFISLINRDGEWVTNGILKGFADDIEALASSFNTANQILVIGRNLQSMTDAVNRLIEMGGGTVALDNGRVAYEWPLPLGGMMSQAPVNELSKRENEFKAFLSKKGYPFHDPFYTLVFLPNDFLPEVRINYAGVLDIINKKTLRARRDLSP